MTCNCSGDHPSTSTAIARQIGIIGPSQVATDAVMTSTQFDQLTMDELVQAFGPYTHVSIR